MAGRFESLSCMKCGASYPIDAQSRCRRCGGLLEARYNVEGGLPDKVSRTSVWDFAELFSPVQIRKPVSMGEGWTPLVGAPNFAKKLGLKSVWCKTEGNNPTGSFKDRAVSLGVSLAVEWNRAGIFTASDGNAGASTAAYAARGGKKCLVLVEGVSTQKLVQTSMYSPQIVKVGGLYDSRSSLESTLSLAGELLPGWMNLFLWAPFNPLLLDAFKTIAYEMALAGKVPDLLFVPVAGGDLLYGLYKGFAELRAMGKLDSYPKLVAVQGEGAAPTVKAIEQGLEEVKETEPPRTVAGALRVNFGGEHSLKAVKETGGFGVAVSDGQILEAQREIARYDGIFCETSSAVVVAAIKKAMGEGKVDRDQTVGAILSGGGLKDYDSISLKVSSIPTAAKPSQLASVLREVIDARSE